VRRHWGFLSQHSGSRWWILWGPVAAVALLIRIVGLRYGLPAVYNPDEVAIMSRALAFAKGDLNPHNFLYPSFYFYVLFAWEGLTAVFAVATRTVSSFGEFQREFFLDPTRVFVAGRLLTAFLGTATVIATGILGARIAGRFAGIAAATLLALSPLHVLNSHYVKHDVPVTLVIVLAYLAFERLWSRRTASVVAAAVSTGVAFSTHYYTIFLAVPLAWSVARSARNPREAARKLFTAAAIAGAVFLLLSPFLIVELQTALRDIRANRQIVVDRAAVDLGYAASAARYMKLLLVDAVGLPTALLAVAGIGIGLKRRPQDTLWLGAFATPFLLFIFSTIPASRYLVPVTPFVAILAATAIDSLRTARVPSVTALMVLAIAAVTAAAESIRTDRFIRQTDTRTLARGYIESRVPNGVTVLTQPYSVPLEPTVEVLKEAVSRSGREMPTKTRLQIERQPYPRPAYRLIYLGRGLDADKLYIPYSDLSGGEPLRLVRAEKVAFVIFKRYNDTDPAAEPFLTALAREGRRIAVISPYRDASSGARPEPFLHNTDARIDASLERPGPVVEIWQLDGPRS